MKALGVALVMMMWAVIMACFASAYLDWRKERLTRGRDLDFIWKCGHLLKKVK